MPLRKSFSRLSALAALLPLGFAQSSNLPPGFAETRIASGLNPVTMTFAPDGRLFLCEKQGLLRVVSGGKLLEKPALDLTDRVDSWNERGLISVCFDPDFARNGWLYIYHTHNRDPKDTKHESSNNRVSRFTLKGNVADPGSEQVIVEIDNLSKTGWHNGGGLAFGKDGKLYVSTGENANGSNAQDSGNLLGKLLRFNKDGSVPSDNPFYREYKGNNRAIVALGLRNPFAIAVQPGTGLLYLNMVGANFEQIERYETGKPPEAVNYGWPDIDGPPKNKTTPQGYRAPEYAYDHGSGKGVALCSGDFYQPFSRGADAFPASYKGKYFFSDYGGWIKFIDPAKPDTRLDFATGINRPIDVKTAPDGALWYIERAGIPGGSDTANSSSKDGSLWRVRWTGEGGNQTTKPAEKAQLLAGLKLPATADETLPTTLSATGVFTDRNLTPRPGILPYGLNSTIWADGATIRRWVALPDGKKIGFSPTSEFKWPGGTVFIQHFEMPTGGTTRRLETRLLVLDATGSFGYGANYRWRADGSEADLVDPAGQEEVLKVGSREQTWTYPSSGLCFMCHTPNSGFVLGPKARQLNGDFAYPGGKADNQLHAWNRLKMFDPPLNEKSITSYPKTCRIDDPSASLEDRVRSYLDGNCSHCHRPGGTGAGWDARFEIPLAAQGIIGGEVRNTLGIEGAKVVVPGDMAKSILHTRMAATGIAERMPPVTRNVPDTVALEAFEKWISGLKER
ncbi:MAG: PQQ-dependent sugar dehydrogenase [Luteolibacter sp.]